jgi:hypothetical protein
MNTNTNPEEKVDIDTNFIVRATSYLDHAIPLFLSQLELSTKIQKPSLPFST